MLNALANDPARLHHTAPAAPSGNATDGVALPEDLTGVEMSGVAGAIMVFEQVIRVRSRLHRGRPAPSCICSFSETSMLVEAALDLQPDSTNVCFPA